MTTDTATPLSERLAPLAARYADLTERRAHIDEQLEEVKAAIRDLVPGPDAYQAGDLVVTVSANRRFDEKRALELVPEVMRDSVTYPETRIRKDVVKALLPEVYEAAQVTYVEKVTVKPA